MFGNFCTGLKFNGVVEVVDIGELKTFKNSSYIEIKVQTTRRRMSNGQKIYDHDTAYLKSWSTSAEYINKHLSVGDIIEVYGELRGNFPNVDLRITKFEILTPTDSEMDVING